MNDSLKFGEYYVLIFYRKDFYEYLSYVDIDNDIVRNTFKPERAIRFDSESDAKIFFFNKFGFFQRHGGTTLIEVAVGKMAVKYELEICKDSYIRYQIKDEYKE